MNCDRIGEEPATAADVICPDKLRFPLNYGRRAISHIVGFKRTRRKKSRTAMDLPLLCDVPATVRVLALKLFPLTARRRRNCGASWHWCGNGTLIFAG